MKIQLRIIGKMIRIITTGTPLEELKCYICSLSEWDITEYEIIEDTIYRSIILKCKFCKMIYPRLINEMTKKIHPDWEYID